MKDKDIKLNMTVKIISKYNRHLETCVLYKILKERNQKYAYVTKIHPGTYPIIYSLSEDIDVGGDHFIGDDFEPYIKEERKKKLQKIYKHNE